MLLFLMLENDMHDATRGDIVLFNNIPAERPETYKFVSKCKELCKSKYGYKHKGEVFEEMISLY